MSGEYSKIPAVSIKVWQHEGKETGNQILETHSGLFQKIVVENGYGQLRPDEDGILHVGVIPFLLDTSILDGIIKAAKSSQIEGLMAY